VRKHGYGLILVLVIMLSLLQPGCSFRNTNRSPVDPTDPKASVPISPVLKIHFIDVGQGDAILVQTPAGENMLIDAGDNDQGVKVVSYLNTQGVRQLDFVVATHPHADHIGGLDTVINNIPVKSIYMPKVTYTTESYKDLLVAIKSHGLAINTARYGVDLPMAGIKARFLSPLQDTYEELNDYSAVLKLDFGTQAFLFTGDAGSQPESEMLARKLNLAATVLKVGHHSSFRATGDKFLAAVAPQYAIIMLGADNDYGYPHTETLAKLKRSGIQILRTDQNGTIVVTTDGSSLQIVKGR
jgi:competence protein ComEC